jgi:hypothetical protein
MFNQFLADRKVQSLSNFVLPFCFYPLFPHEPKLLTFLREPRVDMRIQFRELNDLSLWHYAKDINNNQVSHVPTPSMF